MVCQVNFGARGRNSLYMVRQPTLQRLQTGSRQPVTLLSELFPSLPEVTSSPSRKALRWLLTALAVVAGSAVMLARVGQRGPLDTIYVEDGYVFLLQALAYPGHIFISDGGYLELFPRLAAQLAALGPLRDAAVVLSFSGAIAAAGTAVFIYYASAGHVRTPWLRALLGLSVILLPIAPLEIADSAVGAPWYLLLALFWATLWRPRSASGRAVAAVMGFLATASTTMAFLLFPILLLRVAALRRVREHAVTIGCAVGLVLQVIVAHSSHQSRLRRVNPPGSVLAYYAHEVVLRSVGWHVSWGLQKSLGLNGATAVVGVFLAVAFGWILVAGSRRVRLLVVVALVTGFISTYVPTTLQAFVPFETATQRIDPASRYTVVALFLFAAAAIVAVDDLLRGAQRAGPAEPAELPGPAEPAEPAGPAEPAEPVGLPRASAALSPVGVAAAVTLVAVLSLGWITDFRSPYGRGGAALWEPIAAQMLTACRHSPSGFIEPPPDWTTVRISIPCANLRS
jgi:hypothetical protein